MASKLITKTVRNPLRAALLAGITAIALAAGSGVASAEPITPSSDFTVTFSNAVATGVTASATAEFSNFDFSAPDKVSFQILATNTSVGTSSNNDVRFTAFGWNTDPNTSAVSSSSTGNVYKSTTNTKISSQTLDICLHSGSKCNGGSNAGLEDPNNRDLHGDPTTTTVNMTLSFSSSVPPLTFSNFYGKFQTYNGSFEDGGTVNKVPEPGSLALLGTGLIGLGLALRRRRRT